ncbi:uncharacterized protein LOC108679784, partial [Hyalella azteca]|uniref:Uncharacterized protein LOC108679784 n=1 Tax=Hyalella azteca TaxID=294128 RepID=A0A979FX90_HYAAZ
MDVETPADAAREEEEALASSRQDFVNEELAASFSQAESSQFLGLEDLSLVGRLADLADENALELPGSSECQKKSQDVADGSSDESDEGDEALSFAMSQPVWLSEHQLESSEVPLHQDSSEQAVVHPEIEDMLPQNDGSVCGEALVVSDNSSTSPLQFSSGVRQSHDVHSCSCSSSSTAPKRFKSRSFHVLNVNEVEYTHQSTFCLKQESRIAEDQNLFSSGDESDDSDVSSVASDFSIDQIDGDPKDHRHQRARFPPPPSHTMGRFQGGLPYDQINSQHIAMGYLPPRPGAHIPSFEAVNNTHFGNPQFQRGRPQALIDQSSSHHPNHRARSHGNFPQYAMPQVPSTQRNVPYSERQSSSRHHHQSQNRRDYQHPPADTASADLHIPRFKVIKAQVPSGKSNQFHHPHGAHERMPFQRKVHPVMPARSSLSLQDSSGTINVLPVPDMSEERIIPGIGGATVVPALMSNKPITLSSAIFESAPQCTELNSTAGADGQGKSSSAANDIIMRAMNFADPLGEFFNEEETPPVASETVIESTSVHMDNDSTYRQDQWPPNHFVGACTTVVSEDDSSSARHERDAVSKKMPTPDSSETSSRKTASKKSSITYAPAQSYCSDLPERPPTPGFAHALNFQPSPDPIRSLSPEVPSYPSSGDDLDRPPTPENNPP